MATPPLPANVLARIEARNQSVRWTAILREVRTFAAYICNIDSDVIMGVSAAPVVVLTITPNPVCLGEDISWDLSGSFAPGDTVASYSITFGDGNSDNVASGTHTYGAVGSYTVTGQITSVAGLTQTLTREVNVLDCTDPGGGDGTGLLGAIYASTDGSGVYYWT